MINLHNKTGLGRSGHVRFQTFGPIWHVSGPKMVFWRNDIMILHHFCWRSSKIKLFWPKTLIFDQKLKNQTQKTKIGPKPKNSHIWRGRHLPRHPTDCQRPYWRPSRVPQEGTGIWVAHQGNKSAPLKIPCIFARSAILHQMRMLLCQDS